jgi:hypothetical protein
MYSLLPSGVSASPSGDEPARTVLEVILAPSLIWVTVNEPWFRTYAIAPCGVTAI